MEKLSKFVDMALSPEERLEQGGPVSYGSDAAQPIYPYGLCICLSQREMDKLDLSDEVNAGDMMIFQCVAKVTSVTENDTTDGPKRRVELQITGIAAQGENEEEEEPRKIGPRSLYKK